VSNTEYSYLASLLDKALEDTQDKKIVEDKEVLALTKRIRYGGRRAERW
jgi:hypothetical protein